MNTETLILLGSAVPSSMIGGLGFFAKRTLTGIESSIEKVAIQVEVLNKSFNTQDKEMALLKQRLEAVERRCDKCDERSGK